jgi:putative addiction module component (TIGR02574 family)
MMLAAPVLRTRVARSAMMARMNAKARRLLDEAMKLPSADRAELFEQLGARLETEHGGEAGALSDAWRAEVARRIARVDAGQVELLDVEELERELWAEQLADEVAETQQR